MESLNPNPSHLECEALFQKAANEYVSSYKKEVVEFYLDELSKKLKYEVSFKQLVNIISDDLSTLNNTDTSRHLLNFPLVGEIFSIIRIGRSIKNDPDSVPIQYLDCEILRIVDNEYMEFSSSIIYDRRIVLYPLKPENSIIIKYNELPYWYFKK